MNYKICNRCVMNNASDDTIIFDESGNCNYCTKALSQINTTVYFPGISGKEKLEKALSDIKDNGKNKDYDCVMGLSGGLDSSYLAYLGHEWGLRILAIHIDDGFNTAVSKLNIEKLVKACNIELHVIKPDPQQFTSLTKAYLLAGVPNLAIPQDNVLFAFLYETVRKQKIKYFLTGGNFALESILQQGNTFSAMDVVNIKSIHRKFNDTPINKLRFISSYRKYFDMKVTGMKTLRLLDLIDYNRERAFRELNDFCGFEYYGGKHLENALTAFIQLFWLPKKFGVDKRTSHLSSMIVSGQITREEALKELDKPIYDEEIMCDYIKMIKMKLNITDDDFNNILAAPTHQHTDYRTDKVAVLLHKLLSK